MCVTYMYVCNIYMYIHVGHEQKAKEQHQHLCIPFSTLVFKIKSLIELKLTSWLDLMASEPQGFLCLHASPPELGLQTCATLASTWLPGIQTQVPVLML